MTFDALGYAVVFVSTLGLALVLTPLMLRVALWRDIVDRPSEIKAQESPVPYLGGAAIVVAFALVVLVASAVEPPVSGLGELAVIIGCALLLALMGLVDDLRGLSPLLRVAVEIAVGVAVWASPAGAETFGSAPLDLLVTVAWIVAVTNAFNLLDNMDGLSSGVAAIIAGSIFVLAAGNGQFLVAVLAIALAGCSLGFLRSNFHPARIYMGDAGALFIGFLLAVLALKLRFDGPRELTLFIPILLLGVPLFDTTVVTINRLIHGRNPLSGGRDHTSHRLVFVGIPVPVTVGLVYTVAASLGLLAYVIDHAERTAGFIVVGWALTLSVTAGVLLSLVPVYETSNRQHLMITAIEPREEEPPAGFGSDAAEAS